MAPLLSPTSGPLTTSSSWAELSPAGAADSTPLPLSEGPKIKYTVPNPAIAASKAAAR